MRSLFHTIMGKVGGVVNPLWDGIQAYYKLDNTALDSVNTNDLTLVNGTTYATGKINNGLTFDGVNDYASIPTSLFDFTGDFTINMWINLAVLGNMGLWQNNTASNYSWLNFTGERIRWVGALDQTIMYSTTYMSINTWYMVTITRKASTRTRMYINGVLEASDTALANSASNTANRRLGSYYNAAYLNGKMDEVSFFNVEKTASEITELYNSGYGLQYGASYGTLTTAWISATGETDPTIIGALNTLETNGITNGWLPLCNAIYPIVGGDAIKHSFNFANTALYQLSFSAGYNHTSTGATPNGSNAYANTSLNNNTVLSLNSMHISAYSRSNIGTNSALIGCFGASSETSVFPKYAGGSFLYAVNGGEYSVANSDSRGLFSSNRIISSSVTAWKNGIKVATTAGASTSKPNENITLSALNSSGARYYFGAHEISFATIGSGLSDAQQLAMYNDIQAFQTTLNRNV